MVGNLIDDGHLRCDLGDGCPFLQFLGRILHIELALFGRDFAIYERKLDVKQQHIKLFCRLIFKSRNKKRSSLLFQIYNINARHIFPTLFLTELIHDGPMLPNRDIGIAQTGNLISEDVL